MANCKHCGIPEEFNQHGDTCPTQPLEVQVAGLRRVLKWHEEACRHQIKMTSNAASAARAWEGKFHQVKRENNALRRRIWKRQQAGSPVGVPAYDHGYLIPHVPQDAEGTIDLVMEPHGLPDYAVGLRLDAPRLRSFIKRMGHWVEHGRFPDELEPEEYLFLSAGDCARDEARDVARQLFSALGAEWKGKPELPPLLTELSRRFKWLAPKPVAEDVHAA